MNSNHTRFTHLIKDIVLGRALWDVNTFPTHNRLPDLNLDSQTISFFGFSIVPIINYYGDSFSLLYLKTYNFILSPLLRPWLR